MRRTTHALLALVGVLLCAPVCAAQAVDGCPAASGAGANQSRLCVRLRLKAGRVSFERAESSFRPSARYTARLTMAPELALAALYQELERLLASMTEPYRLALSDNERRLSPAAQAALAPPAVRGFGGGWLDYQDPFDAWASSAPDRADFATVVSVNATAPPDGLIVPLVNAHERNGLLIYEDGSYDPSSAFISFFVADPISDLADATQLDLRLPGLTNAGALDGRLKKLRGVLRKQAGRPRCGLCIERALVAYYRDLGLSAQVRVDNASSSPLVVSVIEAPRVVGVSWLSLAAKDEVDVDKVLYSLLTDRAFRASLRDSGPCARAAVRSAKQFNYQNCTGRPGPYLSLPTLQVQQQLVNQLGYTVSLAPAPGDADAANYILVFQKTAGAAAAAETPEAAPSLPDDEGHVDPHEQEAQGATEPAPETDKRERGEEPKDRKNFIGGGVEYRPGQGARFFGLGQRQRLPLLRDAVTSVSANGGAQANDGALGAFNFFSDYVLFNKLHRRVSVQLTINSDLDADRALMPTTTASAMVDERRRGGVGRLELEPFRDRGGQLLRFYAEGRRDTVELSAGGAPALALRQNLTTLDLGALYVFESRAVEGRARARFEPRLRLGLGLAAGEPRFTKWSATGALHRRLPRRFEFDLNGRVEAAGRATPLFELPAFGGADSVRGFRRDDALGRKVWSLQNELWVPLPVGGGEGGATGFKALLRQSVKLAPFVDLGGLHDAVRGTAGARAGAGLGVRLVYNPVVFKLDYGYGFGEAATGGSHGKVHFGVVSNLPF